MITALNVAEFISLLLAALVGGMYWGPWLALSRSFDTFPPDVLLPIVRRMGRNMASLMPYLTIVQFVSLLPILYLSMNRQPTTFYLTLAGLVCFTLALVVTLWVEIPIVKQMSTWQAASLPTNWQQSRDRWGRFHLWRVGGGLVGLACLMAGALS